MNMLLQKSANHSAFLAWLAGEFRLLSKKRNKLAMLQTFEMKTGGATRSALTIAAKRSRYFCFSCFLLLLGPSFPHRPIIAKSTFLLNSNGYPFTTKLSQQLRPVFIGWITLLSTTRPAACTPPRCYLKFPLDCTWC